MCAALTQLFYVLVPMGYSFAILDTCHMLLPEHDMHARAGDWTGLEVLRALRCVLQLHGLESLSLSGCTFAVFWVPKLSLLCFI